MNAVTKAANLRANPNPIDPDVVVPAAVRRAAEAATAAQAAAYPTTAPQPAPAPAPGDGIVIAAPTATVTVTPVGNEPPAPAVTPTPAPAPEPQSDVALLEQRARSAEGRYQKAEKLNSQLAERVASLESLIQDMQAAPRPAAQPAATPSRLVTAEEENEFGTELLDVVGRRARETVSPEIAELRQQMSEMEKKLTGVGSTVQRTARGDMIARLNRELPDWQVVNEMPEFKAWLALPDPMFGVKRHPALLSAFEQNDTTRVLNFFNGFVSELAATIPAAELPAPTAPAAPQPVKPGLEALAAPGRARTPAAHQPPVEKPIITTDDVKAFYADKRRGAYNGREAEFAALERELFQAQQEGRVRSV